MKRLELEAQKRDQLGKKVKKLRKDGLLPANVFGKKIKSQSITINFKDFLKVFKEVGETGLIDLKVGSEALPVLIKDVQRGPVGDEYYHVSFQQVSLTEKTTANIEIEMVGEAPAVEEKLGILIQVLKEIEVEALPQDLPEKLEVNVSGLKAVNDSVTVADITYDKAKVELKVNPEEMVAKIDELAQEEVVEAPVEAAEGEVPAEGETTEGGEAAEGEQAPAEGEEQSQE